MTKKRPIGWLIALIAVTTLLIWGQSLLNVENSQAESDAVRGFLSRLLGSGFVGSFFYRYIRKVAHFTEYAVLGTEWSGLRRRLPSRPWWPALTGPVTAMCDEALQAITDRAPRLTDVLLDSAGFVCGWLLLIAVAALCRYFAARQKRREKSS